MWISVNPLAEREEIIWTAMALSGWYKQGWSECGQYLEDPPLPEEVHPNVVALLYNHADNLGLDIFTASEIGGE